MMMNNENNNNNSVLNTTSSPTQSPLELSPKDLGSAVKPVKNTNSGNTRLVRETMKELGFNLTDMAHGLNEAAMELGRIAGLFAAQAISSEELMKQYDSDIADFLKSMKKPVKDLKKLNKDFFKQLRVKVKKAHSKELKARSFVQSAEQKAILEAYDNQFNVLKQNDQKMFQQGRELITGYANLSKW